MSVAPWIHLGPGSDPPPFACMIQGYIPRPVKLLAKHELGANEIHFVMAHFCQKGGGTLAIFM